MVKYYLKVSATLDGVTDLEPVDTPENVFEYTFRVECTKCRTIHPKPIGINQYEQHEITGSKGEASFVFRCKECKHEHSASIMRTKNLLTPDDKTVALLEIDARGVEFVEFIPQGIFTVTGAELGTKFTEVELDEGEWFDYDDKAGAEVSITDVKWEIERN